MFMISGRFKFKGKFIVPWFIIWVSFALSGTQPAPAVAATWLSETDSYSLLQCHRVWGHTHNCGEWSALKWNITLLGKLQDAFATVSKQATSATKDTVLIDHLLDQLFSLLYSVLFPCRCIMLPNKSACDLTFNWCMNMESNRSVQGSYSLLLRCTFCERCAAVVVVVYYAVLPAAKACSINQRFRCL